MTIVSVQTPSKRSELRRRNETRNSQKNEMVCEEAVTQHPTAVV